MNIPGMPLSPADAVDVNDPEQQDDVVNWRRGCALRSLVKSPEWEILCDTLKSYADSAELDLFRLPPGDPAVPTAHAAWSALKQVAFKFKANVEKCVEESFKTPESIQRLAKLSPNQ